ncbi:hypothetical protein GUJ93_ZPchr0013g36214 [Zizania palustris]|uniref:Uncharacterized protein n=1 Tax=Zizania palustris TaxID=103762 RepID=A0A8J5X395_ZIZPA|nr:hypothetical protein GUJ93_ZPchr0013g36214 [Zizania palustris]
MVACAIATVLHCPLLDKDDVRHCTGPLERNGSLPVSMCNKLSYAVLWYVAEWQMASSILQPGVPVTLQELEPSSELFRQGASLRVTGILQSYDLSSAVAVIQDGSASFKVDTQHLRDISFRTNSTYQFIGELLIKPDNDAILQARVGRNVDGLDLNLYQQSLVIRRQYEAKLRSSRE